MADRRGIRGRIVLLVSLGALAPLAALGVGAGVQVGRLRAQVREGRAAMARTLAVGVSAALERELAGLAGIASDARFDPSAAGPHDRALLHQVLSRSSLLERAFVARADGGVVAEPQGALPPCATAAAGRPGIDGSSGPLCLLVPVESGGRHTVLGGVVKTGGPAWSRLVQPPSAGEEVSITDARGRVVAGTAGAGPGEEGAAVVPVALTEWQLAVREPAAVSAARARLRAAAAFAFALVVPLVLVFAWGAARSVTRPLATLARAAGRIAVGHIEEPLPDLGSDEVGRLGRAMEAMRSALERALEAAARGHQRLEQRVEERTRELERLNAQLRERERARAQLLRKVITAQEDERKRIARELHDESCQTLSVLAMKLDELRARLADAEAAQQVAAARALAVRTLDEVHRLIFDLRPALLDDLGLPAALRWLVARHLEPAGIAVRVEMAPLEARLPVETETAVFRAAQEVLTNVARHAEASTVLIQAGRQGGQLVIEMEDDGRGFDPASVEELAPSGRGLGLLGIRERMELLGGSAEIDSSPGEGTRIVLKVPLPPGASWLASAS
ncbi:MAG TPA: ATP-binding protein [Vicinamibacteria bacterium]|nr:ATP-binding protein [Vicinamibacteria bacterium]